MSILWDLAHSVSSSRRPSGPSVLTLRELKMVFFLHLTKDFLLLVVVVLVVVVVGTDSSLSGEAHPGAFEAILSLDSTENKSYSETGP